MSIIGAQAEPQTTWSRLKSAFGGGQAATSAASAEEKITPNKRSWAMGALGLATIGGILANQAKQVERFGADDGERNLSHDFLSFISRVIGTVMTPLSRLRTVLSDLTRPQDESGNNHNQSLIVNKLESIFPRLKKTLGSKLNLVNNLFDNKIAGSIGSLIFAVENMLSSFFYEVPEGEKSKLATFWGAFFPPFAKFSSLLGSLLSVPGHAAAAILRFNKTHEENNKGYKAANFIARLGDIFQPVAANLNAFYRTLLAFKLARTKNISQEDANNHYGINGSHMFQGIIGSLLAVPSFFGSLSRFRLIFTENENKVEEFLTQLTTRAREILQKVGDKYNIQALSNIDLNKTSKQVTSEVKHYINNCKHWLISGSESLCNLPLIKDLLRGILPYDQANERITLSAKIMPANSGSSKQEIDPEHEALINRVNKDPQNLIKIPLVQSRFINKTSFLELLDYIIRPVQSILMLLPSALPRISDPDINTHGNGLMRAVDKVLGLSSALLGLPSFLVYVFSSRAPQMMATYYGLKQKHALANGDYNYNARDEMIKLQENLLNNKWLPFARFIGRSLDRIIHDQELGPKVFHNEQSFLTLLDRLGRDANSQERHVKTITALDVARRFLKTMIFSPIAGRFFKSNTPRGELNSRDQAKARIHKAITGIEAMLKLIPGIGWLFALPLGIIKKPFMIEGAENVDPMQAIRQGLGAAVGPTAAQMFGAPRAMTPAAMPVPAMG